METPELQALTRRLGFNQAWGLKECGTTGLASGQGRLRDSGEFSSVFEGIRRNWGLGCATLQI